jgi:hypothetical protein
VKLMVSFRSSYVKEPENDTYFLINFSSVLVTHFRISSNVGYSMKFKDKYLGNWFRFKRARVKYSVCLTDDLVTSGALILLT